MAAAPSSSSSLELTPAAGAERRLRWNAEGLDAARAKWHPAADDPSNIWFSAATGDLYNELPTFPVRPSYAKFQSSLRVGSQCVVFDGAPNDPHRPASTPIYQTATFVQPTADTYGSYDYTRSGNPTRTALERHVAMLEKAHAAFAFSTGMAALNAVTRLLQSGDELIVGTDIYGGMHRLITRVTSMHGIRVKPIDVTDVEAVKAAIGPSTKMIHLESPSNPLMMISDIRALSAVCNERGVLLSIDSSMMPPVLMRCITLGADIVVHSATKFLAGHSDTMAGVVCCRTEEIAKRIAFYQNAEGTGLAPFDSWLVLRGIKTMDLRVERAQSNATHIAHVLREHPRVKDVFYAGIRPLPPDERRALIASKRAALANSEVVKRRVLEAGGDAASADAAAAKVEAGEDVETAAAASAPLSPSMRRKPSERLLAELAVDVDKLHPIPSAEELDAMFEKQSHDYATHFSQSLGGGVVISFTTGSVHLSQRVIDALRIFKLTVSFGSCNSLVEMPCVLSHASVPAEDRTIPEDLVRLSVGVEDVRDLVEDLRQAFELATHPHVEDVRFVTRHGSAAALEHANGASKGDEGTPATTVAPSDASAAEVATMRRQLAGLSEHLEALEGERSTIIDTLKNERSSSRRALATLSAVAFGATVLAAAAAFAVWGRGVSRR